MSFPVQQYGSSNYGPSQYNDVNGLGTVLAGSSSASSWLPAYSDSLFFSFSSYSVVLSVDDAQLISQYDLLIGFQRGTRERGRVEDDEGDRIRVGFAFAEEI